MHTARLEEEDTPASMTTASIRTMPLAARARRGPAGGCLFPDGQRIKVFGKIIHAVRPFRLRVEHPWSSPPPCPVEATFLDRCPLAPIFFFHVAASLTSSPIAAYLFSTISCTAPWRRRDIGNRVLVLVTCMCASSGRTRYFHGKCAAYRILWRMAALLGSCRTSGGVLPARIVAASCLSRLVCLSPPRSGTRW
jgi:hypothetical protein